MMKDFTKIVDQLKQAQAKIQEIQQEVLHLQATGEAGAGLVKATVNGHKKLIALEIDASIMQPNDQECIQDLVIAATNLAIQKIEDQIKGSIQKNTLNMLGDLPLDFLI